LKTAREVVGKEVTSNIVAVGAINQVLGLASEETLQKAVLRHVPKQTVQMNTRALREGIHLINNKNEILAENKISA
ncbi:MAG: 2-oxoacid:acceptor oxidoreductase family protein, partial [Bacillota bacterium]